MPSFPVKLKLLRESLSLTQEELAARLGFQNQAISNYERDLRKPDFETLQKMCLFFNVSSDFMLGFSDCTIRRYQLEDLIQINKNSLSSLKVYDTMTSTFPIGATTSGEQISIPSEWKGIHWAIKMPDESMEPFIKKEDIVIIEKKTKVATDDLVFVSINKNVPVIRKIIKTRKITSFISLNNNYSSLEFYMGMHNHVQLLGKVVEIRRRV